MIGQAALHRQLERVPNLILAELRPLLEREAAKLVEEMRALVPVDEGRLRDSIGWTWGDVPKGALKIGTVKGKAYGALSITVYAGDFKGDKTAFYAYFVEFGTTATGAQPFFFPVYRANRKRIKSAISRGVKRAMKRSNTK